MRVLVLLQPTIARFAPSVASASAAANPMPLVAPVIRICLSFHGTAIQGSGHPRLICSIIFDCWQRNGIKFSMLSTARYGKSSASMRNKNHRKETNAGH